MARRKPRPGETVCRCGAYRFPHRFMGGDCNGGGWVLAHWEKNQWGSCRDCVFYAQREAAEWDAEYGANVCQILTGQDEPRECPELIEHIRFEGARLYGVNKPPRARMGWRR